MRAKQIVGFKDGADKIYFRKTRKYIVAVMKYFKLHQQDQDAD